MSTLSGNSPQTLLTFPLLQSTVGPGIIPQAQTEVYSRVLKENVQKRMNALYKLHGALGPH